MDAEKRDILHEHLGYEIDMVASAIAAIAAGDADWFRRMCAIEAFWLHARTLLEFFEDRTAPSRTAAAQHFTDKPIEFEIPSRTKYEALMNDQIAHLNYGRTRNELEKLRGHDVYVVAGALARAILVFEKHLRSDAREIWETRTSGRLTIDAARIFVSDTRSATGVFQALESSTSTATMYPVTGWTGPRGPT